MKSSGGPLWRQSLAWPLADNFKQRPPNRLGHWQWKRLASLGQLTAHKVWFTL